MEYTASEILNMTEPGELFTDDIDIIKDEFTKLAKKWHPDVNGNSIESNAVMSKLNELYSKGLELIKDRKWKGTGFIKFPAKNGKVHEVKYNIHHEFELGDMYIGNTVVVYIFPDINKDFVDNTKKMIKSFKYSSDRMKNEVERYLPKIVTEFETTDNKLGLVISKTPDLILLQDVLKYYDNEIPDRHVAWILSSLYNLVCYLDYAGITHNSITLETYFISPKYHSGALLGGWWAAVPRGNELLGVPQKIYNIMSLKTKDSKCGDTRTDIESIRLVGRELFGDSTGTKIDYTKPAPQPIIDWLRGISSKNAVEEYKNWVEVLKKGYGERKFEVMDIDIKDFYKKVRE